MPLRPEAIPLAGSLALQMLNSDTIQNPLVLEMRIMRSACRQIVAITAFDNHQLTGNPAPGPGRRVAHEAYYLSRSG